jgi:hypothetical protein
MGKLDKNIIVNRLARIKYLYKIGIEQSKQVEAFAGFSILTFHDSAEMFLLLILEDREETIQKNRHNKISFMEYWDLFKDLTLRKSMNNLKERRKNIKHKGLFPSISDIEESRITITNFFRENTLNFFGIDFDSISLADLIEFPNIKEFVLKAESCLRENKIYECLCNARIGFEELLSTYESDKKQWYRSIFDVGEKIGTDYHRLVSNVDIAKRRWFDQVTKTTNAMRDILKISALGINYRKYAFFNFLTPTAIETYSFDGERKYTIESTQFCDYKKSIKIEDCRFCIDFVIDSALKLQEFQFNTISV